jgi:hypothetical protein
MARCAVPVAERSVRRRHEPRPTHGSSGSFRQNSSAQKSLFELWQQPGYIRVVSKTAATRTRIEPGLPFEVRIPNDLTARTLRESRAGKGVKRFGSKTGLYGDLGL